MYGSLPSNIEHIATIDLNTEPYSFYDFIVVMDMETKEFYTSSDSGCSCPTPFEYHTFPEDYSGPYTFHEVAEKIKGVELSGFAITGRDIEDLEASKVRAIEQLMKARNG